MWNVFRPSLFYVTALALAGCKLAVQDSSQAPASSVQAAPTAAAVVCNESGSPFGGGSGTASDPYLLCSTTHVQNLSTDLDGHFRVTRDIDFSAVTSWTPIGSDSVPFTGTLDGNNKKFHDLTINLGSVGNSDWVGLFQTIGDGATVKSLTLEDFSVSGNNMTGALAGHINANTLAINILDIQLKNVTIITKAMGGGLFGRGDASLLTEPVRVTRLIADSVSVSSSANGSLCGNTYDTGAGAVYGRAGGYHEVSGAVITNASVAWSATGVNVSGWTHVGGVVGYTGGGFQLTDSSFQGSVNGGRSRAGGLIGQFDNNGTTYPGSIVGVRVYNTTVVSSHDAGGFAGMLNRRARTGMIPVIERSSFQGTITSTGAAAGGIAGAAYFGSADRVSIKAAIMSGGSNVGGLFGWCSTCWSVSDVVFTGSVSATGASSDAVGLIVGGQSATTPVFQRVYAVGTLSNANASSANTHYDFGANPGAGTYSGVYYRSAAVSGWSSLQAIGLTDAQLVDQSQFSGYDFSANWVMASSPAYTGFLSPVLRVACGKDGVACP